MVEQVGQWSFALAYPLAISYLRHHASQIVGRQNPHSGIHDWNQEVDACPDYTDCPRNGSVEVCGSLALLGPALDPFYQEEVVLVSYHGGVALSCHGGRGEDPRGDEHSHLWDHGEDLLYHYDLHPHV